MEIALVFLDREQKQLTENTASKYLKTDGYAYYLTPDNAPKIPLHITPDYFTTCTNILPCERARALIEDQDIINSTSTDGEEPDLEIKTHYYNFNDIV